MKEITFEGELSGDGECFCWKVDLETFKKFNSDWELELEIRGIDVQGTEEEPYFLLYPGTVLRSLGASDGKKFKLTLKVEET